MICGKRVLTAEIERIQRLIDENEYMKNLGIELIEVWEGSVTARIPVTDAVKNPYGSVHGGCLYAFADIVAGFAACTSGRYSSTINGNMNFLKPAMDTEYITCTAIRERQGKSVGVYHVNLFDDKEQLLETGTFTFYMLSRKFLEE